MPGGVYNAIETPLNGLARIAGGGIGDQEEGWSSKAIEEDAPLRNEVTTNA